MADFFHTTATGRALRDATRSFWRWVAPAVGAIFLLTALVHALGGPCLLPGSIACSF